MKRHYRITSDGMQWELRETKDVKVKVPEGEQPMTKRKEEIIAWYPLFHQALGRMYEEMVREGLEAVDYHHFVESVETAKSIYEKIKNMKPNERVSL
jgi:GTP1/Obg family GTP-binding protein